MAIAWETQENGDLKGTPPGDPLPGRFTVYVSRYSGEWVGWDNGHGRTTRSTRKRDVLAWCEERVRLTRGPASGRSL